MSTDLMNIASFKDVKPSAAFASLDPQAESLADGIGSSYGIIGYKGKVWSLRLRGETYNFTRPEEGGGFSPAPFLDVIVLRQLPAKSKSFYPPGSYNDGQIGVRPLCAALDGVTPDADITTPQSTSCVICPRNVFKLNAEGRKTRECSDYKRTAVLILPKMTKDLLGAALIEPVFLRVPAASLNDLALFGEGMRAQGFHFSTYVTRIGFNPEKPHPQMTFRATQKLGDKEAAIVMPLRDDPVAFRITGENEVGSGRIVVQRAPPAATIDTSAVDAARLAAAKAAAEAEAAVAAQSIAHAKNAAEAKLAAEHVKAAAAKVEADRVAAHTVTAPVTESDDLGFGDEPHNEVIGRVSDAQTAATVAQNTVEDTGAPEESDDDLDSRIAGILPK